MMAMETGTMDDGAPPSLTARVRQFVTLALSGGGIVFLLGVGVGLIGAQVEKGGPVGITAAILAVVAVLLSGLIWLSWRTVRALIATNGPPTRRERLNWMVLGGCALLGWAIATAILIGSESPLSRPDRILSGAPIPPALAVGLAAVVFIVVPAISIYWHRRVMDEQDAKAYGDGVMAAFYLYGVGAPGWWLLWRGGIAPAPDGITIYFATMLVALAGWFWSKYR